MDDDSEGVVVISSSPEPEDFRSVRADKGKGKGKGKGRATNGDLLELTSDSDLDLGSVLFRATASGALGRNNAPGPSNQNIQPIASGSGTNVEIPVIEDPIEAAMIQVLDVIPNVDSDHLRTLVVTFHSQGHEDVGTAIISQLLENPDYPKSTIKRKVTEDAQSPSKRTKVDYLAPDRNGITDIGYINLSLDHLLRVDFPTIPKDYVKRTFFGAKSLYAPTYIQLKEDLEDGTKFMCNKATQRADTPRRKGKSKSKAKAKVPAENKDFERERRWLLQYLDDKAELDECERDGTGVECGCCFGDYPFSWMIQCPDAHLFCRDCARRSAEECIGNRKTELVCMDQSGCKLLFAESEVERFLSGGSLALWHRIKQERELELAQIDGLESCPFCSYAVVIENEQERLFRCEGSTCGIVSCRTCKKEDHLPKSCEEAEKDKALDARHTVEEAMTKAMMRSCPKCNQNFVKDYGCNKMVCPNCQSLSCYACRKLIRGYDHFEQNHPGAPAKKGSSSKCLLWDSVEERHANEVKQAAEAAQEELRRLHPELAEGDLAVDLPVAQAPAAPAPAPVLAPRAPPALPNPLAMPGAYPHGFNPRGLNLQDVMRRQREQMQQAQRLLADQNAVIAQEAARLRQAILGQLPVAPPARAPAPARRRRR